MATEKQKKTFEKALENNGNVSKAMRESGYSENYAKNPQDLKKSKGWQELVAEYLPDELLAKVHTEGLLATRGEQAEPDYATRHKYLDSGYKIKDKYPAQKKAVDVTSKGEKLQILTDPDLLNNA